MPAPRPSTGPKASNGLLRLAVLLALAGLLMPAAAQTLTIRLHEHVLMSRSKVTLGDVAALTGTDGVALQRLAALDIGPAPAAGTTVALARPVLEAWVRRSLHPSSAAPAGRPSAMSSPTLLWQGADTALIERQSQWVDADALEAAARQGLSRHGGEASAALVQALQRTRVPAGRLSLDARPAAAGEPASSRVTVWVDIVVDDQTVSSRPAVFAVDDARATIDVRQGDAVRLFSRSGTVKVEMTAQALQSGRTGQAIRVRGAASEAAVLATVMRAGEVEMLP